MTTEKCSLSKNDNNVRGRQLINPSLKRTANNGDRVTQASSTVQERLKRLSPSVSPRIFRISYGSGVGPSLLRNTLLEAGMIEYDPNCHHESQWNLWWKGYRFKEDEFAYLSSTQRVNHHPTPSGTHADIIKKDGLLRAVRLLCAAHPQCVNLLRVPVTFNLPREESQFIEAFLQNSTNKGSEVPKKDRTEHAAKGRCSLCGDNSCSSCSFLRSTAGDRRLNIWILKPTDMSRGRGIYLFDRLEDFTYMSKSVVQKYITNPLLIEGYKFDLRLYAVVPSYAPFIVYIFTDGLVRFATERFDLEKLNNPYSHLTNSSINVTGPGYLENKKVIGRGCKWTLKQLRRWMSSKGLDDRGVWRRIKIIILLTLLTQATITPKVYNAYELFGFDILIDHELKPWLLEVNASPSLSNDCLVDELVKKPLLTSVLQMLGFHRHSYTPTGLSPDPNSSSVECRSEVMSETKLSDDVTPMQESPLLSLEKETDEISSIAMSKTKSWKRMDAPPPHLNSHAKPQMNRKSLRPSHDMPDVFCKNGFFKHALSKDINNSARKTGQLLFQSYHHLKQSQAFMKTRLYDFSYAESCPLYGPGSELLLPKLQLLSKIYHKLKQPEGKYSTQNAVNSQPYASPHSKVNTAKPLLPIQGLLPRSGVNEYKNPATSNKNAKHARGRDEISAGKHLIPHTFGQLKLAFPFNLATRVACAKEPYGYPDQKAVVRQLIRLAQHQSHKPRGKESSDDHPVMDIPDVWS